MVDSIWLMHLQKDCRWKGDKRYFGTGLIDGIVAIQSLGFLNRGDKVNNVMIYSNRGIIACCTPKNDRMVIGIWSFIFS